MYRLNGQVSYPYFHPVIGEVNDPLPTEKKPEPHTDTETTPQLTKLKSSKKEPKNNTPPHTKKKPSRNFIVWDHFTKVQGGDQKDPKCTCNYSGKDYACDSRRVGTSSLWVYLNNQCKIPLYGD